MHGRGQAPSPWPDAPGFKACRNLDVCTYRQISVCTYASANTCAYTGKCVHMHLRFHLHPHLHYACIDTYMCIDAHIPRYACESVGGCVCVCVGVCLFVCTSVRVYDYLCLDLNKMTSSSAFKSKRMSVHLYFYILLNVR